MGIVLKQWETLDDIAETVEVPDIATELSRLFGQNVIVGAFLCLITHRHHLGLCTGLNYYLQQFDLEYWSCINTAHSVEPIDS